MSRGYSHGSLRDSINLFHLQCCHKVFLSLLEFKNSQKDVYKPLWPHRAMINHDARPKIIDAPWMLIFKMGQGVFCFHFFSYEQSILRLWLSATYCTSDCPQYATNNHWAFVDSHFQDGVESLSLFVLIIKAANTSKTDSYIPKSIFCN